MTTKKIEYFVDLYPNWQDFDNCPCMATTLCGSPPIGGKRVRVIVELPCIGGKQSVTETYYAASEGVKTGFQG